MGAPLIRETSKVYITQPLPVTSLSIFLSLVGRFQDQFQALVISVKIRQLLQSLT